MSRKQKLLDRFLQGDKKLTVADLDTLMEQHHCKKCSSRRGSGLRYVHNETKRVLTFDGPHPEKELKRFHVRKVVQFLRELGFINV